MSALKAGGINTTLGGALVTAFLGFGWCLSVIDGRPADEIGTWLYLWAGVASITLAVSIATFAVDIMDHLEAKMTRAPRGRHVR